MRLFWQSPHFDFMGKRKLALAFSLTLILISIGSLAFQGLELGIDFTGGTLIELHYDEPADLDEVRKVLESAGYERFVVQHFGTVHEVLIQLQPVEGRSSAELSDEVVRLLRSHTEDRIEVRRVEFVGPQVGEELREDGGLAFVYALIGILIYVALRFEYRFAFGAIIALVHDVLITVGFFSVTRIPFDLSVLAAVLAVIGYSLNDTIVVYDRIRENFRRMRKGTTVEIVNASINQTLSRTIITSFTTLLVLAALAMFGGEVIHSFALALIVGVVVGTYSSIYVASTAAVMLGVSRKDLLPPKKEGAEADGRP
ncbi:MAG TPA: protein translocase subunit SecF [Chromatiales bacterium]|nr:protein translocase subunit SecF [Chromatiales bacterium]